MKKIKIVLLFTIILLCNNSFAQTKEYNALLGKALNALYADLPNNCKNLYGNEDKIYKGKYESKIILPNSIENSFSTTNEYPIEFTSYTIAGDDKERANATYNNICNAVKATIINYKNKNYKLLIVETKTGKYPSVTYKLENGPVEINQITISVFMHDVSNFEKKYKYRIGIGVYGEIDEEELEKMDGCVSGNCKNGKGSIEFESGDKYEGDFKNGYAEGEGKYTEKNGTIYTGGLKKGKWDGYGKVVYVNGDIFTGYYQDDKKEGKGKIIYATGNILEGIYSKDKMTTGRFTILNGNYYDGEWENGKFNGTGKFYTKATNTIIEGIFKDNVLIKETTVTTEKIKAVEGCISGDCINGKGSINYENGDKYEGDFINRLPNGQGKYTNNDGAIYIGSIIGRAFNGHGTMVYPNGDIYTGNFIYGLRDGQGKIKLPNGEIFEGIFSGGNKKKGLYNWISGSYYDGEWDNNTFNGKGKYYYQPTNSLREGIFKDGVLIKEKSLGNEKIVSEIIIPSKEFNNMLGKALNALYADMPNDCKSLYGIQMENSKYSYQSKISLPNSIKNTMASYDDFPVIYESNIAAGNDNEMAKQKQNEFSKAILSTTINYKNKNYAIKYLTSESREGNKPHFVFSLQNGPIELDNVKIYLKLINNPDESKPYKFAIAMGVYKLSEVKKTETHAKEEIEKDKKIEKDINQTPLEKFNDLVNSGTGFEWEIDNKKARKIMGR
jgi:hypothetical protein